MPRLPTVNTELSPHLQPRGAVGRALVLFAWVAALVGLAGLLVSLSEIRDPAFGTRAVAGVGFLVTALSLAAAVAIYERQGRQSRQANDEVNHELGVIRGIAVELGVQADRHATLLGQLHTKFDSVVPDEMRRVAAFAGKSAQPIEPRGGEGDGSEPDERDLEGAFPNDLLETMGVSQEDSSKVAAYVGSDIPLKPLTALHQHLIANEEERQVEGGADRLRPDDLVGYRVRGKGPRFWFISTPDSPGSGRNPEARRKRTLWRVSHTGHVVAMESSDDPATAEDAAPQN